MSDESRFSDRYDPADPGPDIDDDPLAMVRTLACWFLGLVAAVCVLYSLIESLRGTP